MTGLMIRKLVNLIYICPFFFISPPECQRMDKQEVQMQLQYEASVVIENKKGFRMKNMQKM